MGQASTQGGLTTHVLDTSAGRPASGVKIELARISNEKAEIIASLITNQDGRTDQPLLTGDAFDTGTYQLTFHVGAYFSKTLGQPEEEAFLSLVPVRFTISDQSHYHVPLLISPFGYSTYRGS